MANDVYLRADSGDGTNNVRLYTDAADNAGTVIGIAGVSATGSTQDLSTYHYIQIAGAQATGAVQALSVLIDYGTSANINGVEANGVAQQIYTAREKELTGVTATGFAGQIVADIKVLVTGVTATGYVANLFNQETFARSQGDGFAEDYAIDYAEDSICLMGYVWHPELGIEYPLQGVMAVGEVGYFTPSAGAVAQVDIFDSQVFGAVLADSYKYNTQILDRYQYQTQ